MIGLQLEMKTFPEFIQACRPVYRGAYHTGSRIHLQLFDWNATLKQGRGTIGNESSQNQGIFSLNFPQRILRFESESEPFMDMEFQVSMSFDTLLIIDKVNQEALAVLKRVADQ